MPLTIENTTKVIEIPVFKFPTKKPAIEIKPEIKPEPEKPIINQKPIEPKSKAEGTNLDQITGIINRIKTQIV